MTLSPIPSPAAETWWRSPRPQLRGATADVSVYAPGTDPAAIAPAIETLLADAGLDGDDTEVSPLCVPGEVGDAAASLAQRLMFSLAPDGFPDPLAPHLERVRGAL
jgi:hypothetical protein